MRRETLRDPGQMLVQPWWQRYCLARSSLTDLILKGALLRASRRMAACSDVPVAILRDGRPSKSAVADFDTLDCRSRASPTSVGGVLRMRAFNFFTRSFAGNDTIERMAIECSRRRGRAGLLFLIERHLLRKRSGDTRALVHA